ncbi:MAG: response regulator [Aeromicrobium sp.]
MVVDLTPEQGWRAARSVSFAPIRAAPSGTFGLHPATLFGRRVAGAGGVGLLDWSHNVTNEVDPASRVRVLVVDDHPIFRAGLREQLETDDFDVVGEAGSGLEALDLVGRLLPQVVLMDIAMSEMNGIETTRRLQTSFPAVDVIILSVYDDEQYVQAALEAGASGYLLKTVETAELQSAVAMVAHGGSVLSPSIARQVLTRLSGSPPASIKLSERERQVLNLAASGAANKRIASELYLSSRTVDAHMRSIFDKLGVSSRTEAVIEAVRQHLIQIEDVD